MHTQLLPLVLLSSLLLVACGDDDPKTDDTEIDDTAADTDTDTDADTDTDTDADADADTDTDVNATIARVEYSFGEGAWQYTVNTREIANLAIIDVAGQVGGTQHTESHRMRLINTDKKPPGQRWAINLPVVEGVKKQVNGANTAFTDDAATEAELTWMATLTGTGGPVDCGVWGASPNIYQEFGCAIITPVTGSDQEPPPAL